jgi:hypothetical protein
MKGRTWCISFKDDAKKDGDITLKWKVIGQDGKPQELPGTWEGYRRGLTARQKADRFFEKLTTTYSRLVGATRAGNLVCFQLKDEAPYKDIAGVEVGDETGQTFDIFDDTKENFIETVRFRIQGIPMTPTGYVRLGIGHVCPCIQVPTHDAGNPIAILQILKSLTDIFNQTYSRLGYTASIQDDEVVIPQVPCEEGASAGTDDIGLQYWLSMTDSEIEPFSRTFDKADILDGLLQKFVLRLTFVEALLQDRPRRRRFERLPSESAAVQQMREFLINGLIRDLQEGFPGIRDATLAIGRLRQMLADNVVTDEEMQAAREIRHWFFER